MIPDLLWRCPLCAANDALAHRQRWPLPERVTCTCCQACWRVRRAEGDNFYLKLENPPAAFQPPLERSITAWYDEMKKTLRLEPLHDPQVTLADGETLYLASQPAELWLEAGQPFPPPPGLAPPASPSQAETTGVLAGRGRLFLTGSRLLWQDPGQAGEFPLQALNGAFTILNHGLAVTSAGWLYYYRFLHESPLKWVTYLGMVVARLPARAGHCFVTSHY